MSGKSATPVEVEDEEGRGLLERSNAALRNFGLSQLALGDALNRGAGVDHITAKAQEFAKEYAETTNLSYVRAMGEEAVSAVALYVGMEGMIRMAQQAFDITLADKPDRTETEMYERLYSFAADTGNLERALGLFIPSVQLRSLWSARWYEQGMPRVVWADHKYPEMLMASSADRTTLSVVKPPWNAFLIDLPPNLLYSTHPRTGGRDVLDRLLVHYHERDDGSFIWNFLAQGPDGIELWRHGLTTDLLLETGDEYNTPLYCEAVTEEDDRIFLLLGRLIIGACLTFSDPSKIREAKRTEARRQSVRHGKGKLPITRNFVVGTPTKVRVREALVEFLEHGGKRRGGPTVRSLVRGHWKSQPYGPKSSLRKIIFREPYWSPSDDSLPAVTREHVVESAACVPPLRPVS